MCNRVDIIIMMNLTGRSMEDILSLLNSDELQGWVDTIPRCDSGQRVKEWDLLLDTVEYDPNNGVGAFSVAPFKDHDFVVQCIRLAPDDPGWKTWAIVAKGELPARTVSVSSRS